MAQLKEPQLTLEAIDRKLEKKESERDEREYMGVSYLGDPCDRALWIRFRHVYREPMKGQQIRLLDRGSREEAAVVRHLRSVGVKLKETGRNQREVSFPPFVKGHCDGIIISGLKESRNNAHVAEFKTSNAKNFAQLESKGVKAAKPWHYTQMQVYMLRTGIARAFYWCVNKDNDQVHTERLYLDEDFARQAVERGNRIALLPEPPEKIGSASWYECKCCSLYPFCHGSATATVSCRTCSRMHVNSDGTWFCSKRIENIEGNHERKAQNCKDYELMESLRKKVYAWS